MSNSVFCLLGLLVITAAASTITAIAQENSSALLNNVTDEALDLDNESLNISVTNITITNITIMNESVLDDTNITEVNATNNTTFVIGGGSKSRQGNSSRAHLIADDLGPIAPKRASFTISGYVHPTKDAVYAGQYLLNAARLSRAVEGTPHGYVTYHN